MLNFQSGLEPPGVSISAEDFYKRDSMNGDFLHRVYGIAAIQNLDKFKTSLVEHLYKKVVLSTEAEIQLPLKKFPFSSVFSLVRRTNVSYSK